MEPVLYYVGQALGQHVTNVPSRDLTAEDLQDVARAWDMPAEEVIDWLVDSGAWQETPPPAATAPTPEPAGTSNTASATVATVETVQANEASRPRRRSS